MTLDQGSIARSFVDARREGRALSRFPGDVPATIGAAYAIQDQAIALHGEAVAGWKVGRINPALGGVDRLAGPIFAGQVVAARAAPVAMPIFAGGFGAAEAEFLLRIGAAPDPARARYTVAEAASLIDAVHVGIEIASSPFAGINDNGPAVTISDFGNNNGLVVGPAVADWRRADLNDWPVVFAIDGDEIATATAATMLDGPFGAARFLFEHLAARGIAPSVGQWISTGAVTGVHQVRPGQKVTTGFGGRYAVACTIVAR